MIYDALDIWHIWHMLCHIEVQAYRMRGTTWLRRMIPVAVRQPYAYSSDNDGMNSICTMCGTWHIRHIPCVIYIYIYIYIYLFIHVYIYIYIYICIGAGGTTWPTLARYLQATVSSARRAMQLKIHDDLLWIVLLWYIVINSCSITNIMIIIFLRCWFQACNILPLIGAQSGSREPRPRASAQPATSGSRPGRRKKRQGGDARGTLQAIR